MTCCDQLMSPTTWPWQRCTAVWLWGCAFSVRGGILCHSQCGQCNQHQVALCINHYQHMSITTSTCSSLQAHPNCLYVAKDAPAACTVLCSEVALIHVQPQSMTVWQCYVCMAVFPYLWV
jgi:hypothetical protein